MFGGFMSVVHNGIWRDVQSIIWPDGIKISELEEMVKALDDNQMVSVISCKL